MRGALVTSVYTLQGQAVERKHVFGFLEWTFIVVLVILVTVAGLFGLFLLAQQFRNPSRRS